jgi:uncharacterized membrane protein
MQSRWKSPVAWTSLALVVALIAKNWFGFEIPGWDGIVTAVIAAGVAFGIFNSPTNPNGF